MDVIENNEHHIGDHAADLSEYVDTATFTPDLRWNYTVRGLMRRGEVSLLFGASNSGKSALAGLLSSCVAAGAPFFMRPTRRGLVVHVAAEAPVSVAERSLAYRDVCVPGEAAPYVVRRSAVDLGDPDSVGKFMRELRLLAKRHDEAVVLVIFDTFVLSLGDLDENSTSDMTIVTEAAKRIAAEFMTHVCLVHHSGKDKERGARGASAIRGAVDTEIELRPCDDGATVVGKNIKQRTLPKDADIHFRIEAFPLGEDEDGRPRTTAKAVRTDARSTAGKAAPRRTVEFDRRTSVLTVLHGMRKAGIVVFCTGDVFAALPPEAFTGVNSDDSRKKAVARALTNIAEAKSGPIKAAPGGWTWA